MNFMIGTLTVAVLALLVMVILNQRRINALRADLESPRHTV